MENQGGSGSYGAYNQIVAEPLTNENFVYWFETVRNYLIGRDVWEVVDGSFAKPPEDGKKKEIVRWRKKNSIALHAILISCGTQAAFSFKSIVSEAKVAWDTLNQIYCLPQPLPEEQQYIAKGIVVEYDVQSLYESLRDNKWNDAKQFIDEHGSSALSAVITPKGQTALHVAAEFGHTHIVEELVNLVPPQNIEILDAWGHTPLATAAYSGVAIEVAQCMLRRNTNALSIADPYMLLPVTNAFALGYKQMGRYLYSVTPLEVLRPQNGPLGSMLLYYCFFSGDLGCFLLPSIGGGASS
ncbi:ankyrin repeat-containing protein NPR4-like isoform X1 [Senna tora]|uniref:Ankyrin repeat-containing protein NPR4-like isoform X1 n=1 Tax=Senna tora TaxID=362788 RepID=A0A834TGA6_9FABA|nr:ankyrin repeat-containing protein NPR4-like isoform X1 [Senna tora]